MKQPGTGDDWQLPSQLPPQPCDLALKLLDPLEEIEDYPNSGPADPEVAVETSDLPDPGNDRLLEEPLRLTHLRLHETEIHETENHLRVKIHQAGEIIQGERLP
jgi:hypothetical protein